MAFDRKTSMYPNHGSSGELEAYGVWVKSEPQDLAPETDDASFPGASDFAGVSDFSGISSFPDSSDFSTGFDDIGLPRADFSDLESNDLGMGDFGFDNFDDGLTGDITDASLADASFQDASFQDALIQDASLGDDPFKSVSDEAGNNKQEAKGEMSTHLLMKIADELSSIRTELSDLKTEFSGNRPETGTAGITEKAPGGFFSGEDNDKIALTGDEMENILSSADLSAEEPPFDPLREEDEAALKRLSEQNDALVPIDLPPEEIDIDFDNLGINLASNKDEPVEQSIDDDIDDDELQALRREGVTPFNDAQEESASVEDDLLALADDGLGDISLDENDAETSLDDTDLNLNIDDLSIDTQAADDASTFGEASTLDLDDPVILDETLALDAPPATDALSLEDSIVLEQTSSLDEALSGDTLSLDDASSLDDALSLEDASALDNTASMDDAVSLDNTSALDEALSMDDALSLDDISSLDDMLSLEPLPGSKTGDLALTDEIETSASKEAPLAEESGGKEADSEETTSEETTSMDASGADTAEDSDLAKEIPEAFEKGSAADESIPFDDDLEAFTDDEVSLDDDPLDDLDKEEPSLAVKTEKVGGKEDGLSPELKDEVKKVLSYMDHLLESLPEEKIEEFAKSEHFDTYKKLFKELGLV